MIRNGRRAVLDSRFGDVLRAGKLIDAAPTQHLLPDFLAKYDRGESIAFGPLILRQDGPSLGGNALQWSDVGEISVRRGILEVQYTDTPVVNQWSRPLSAIPNADLFFAILAQRQPNIQVAANPENFAERKYYRQHVPLG